MVIEQMATASLCLGTWFLIFSWHGLYATSAAAASSGSRVSLTRDGEHASPGRSNRRILAHMFQSDIERPVEPFDVDGAIITGVVGPILQAVQQPPASQPGSLADPGSSQSRTLLHGSRPPWQYSVCNRCTIVSCGGGSCTGHCKKNGKLYFCRSGAQLAAACMPPEPKDVADLPVDSLPDYDSAIITAPAPYIGCAEITGKPTGCPLPFTRATTPDGRRVTVLQSTCMAERYYPDCPSPLYPFGICECRVAVTGSGFGVERGPCNFTELSGGSGSIELLRSSDQREAAAPHELTVEAQGNETQTGFVAYIEEDQQPRFSHNVKVAVGGEDVLVYLDIFETRTEYVYVAASDDYNYIREESNFGDDYYNYDPYTYGPGGDGYGDGDESSFTSTYTQEYAFASPPSSV